MSRIEISDVKGSEFMAGVKAIARGVREVRGDQSTDLQIGCTSSRMGSDGCADESCSESCSKRLKGVAEDIAGREYGDVLPHQDLAVLLGVPPKCTEYYNLVQRLNTRLLRKSKVLENVRGIGYRIVEPDNYTDLALDHFSRAAKQVRKATRVMKFAPVDKMSENGRVRFNDTSDQAVKLRASFLHGLETTKSIAMTSGGILGDHPKDPGVVNKNRKK